MMEDRAGTDIATLSQAADTLVAAASKRPELAGVINTFRANVPAYSVKLDNAKLETLGVPITDAYQTMQTFVGGLYANDFNVFGHTWQVIVQAEPQFRAEPTEYQPLLCAEQRRGNGAAGHCRFCERDDGTRCGLPVQPFSRGADSGRPGAKLQQRRGRGSNGAG